MSTLSSSSARTVSAGVEGIDRDSPITFAEAKEFKKNYSFAIRYVPNSSSSASGDLTTDEAEQILNGGLGLMVVQHVRKSGWVPSATLGTHDGNLCVSKCKSIRISANVSVWCDLEGVPSSASKQGIIDYCNNWDKIVTKAGYRAGLYVGVPCGLTSSELYHDLSFSNYWKSLSASAPGVDHTGYQMIQYGISKYLDGDTIQKDGAGHTPSMCTYGSTVVGIDTTTDVTESHGRTYVFKTGSPQTPTVTVGTSGVVTLMHLSRDNSKGSDTWKLTYVGNSGASAGIYTQGPGEQPLKRFVARVR